VLLDTQPRSRGEPTHLLVELLVEPSADVRFAAHGRTTDRSAVDGEVNACVISYCNFVNRIALGLGVELETELG
jgi:hypothetical protein